MKKIFSGSQILIRNYNKALDQILPNSIRFVETPEIKNEYTYICDIDILILEKIIDFHLSVMNKYNLPFSNVLRSCGMRLTGLHFTKTNFHYPLNINFKYTDLRKTNDEIILKTIVDNKFSNIKGKYKNKVRPVHGYHLSSNRFPLKTNKSISWGLNKKFLKNFNKIHNDKLFNDFLLDLEPKFLILYNQLTLSLFNLFPDFELNFNSFIKINKKLLSNI